MEFQSHKVLKLHRPGLLSSRMIYMKYLRKKIKICNFVIFRLKVVIFDFDFFWFNVWSASLVESPDVLVFCTDLLADVSGLPIKQVHTFLVSVFREVNSFLICWSICFRRCFCQIAALLLSTKIVVTILLKFKSLGYFMFT